MTAAPITATWVAVKLTWVTAWLLCAAGCGTLAGNPEEDDGDGDGGGPKPNVVVAPVTFSLTDAPLDEAQNVFVTVASLSVSRASVDGEADGGGWIDIPLKTAAEIDLLTYQDGATIPLAELQDLPVGTYNQTRLALAEDKPPRLVLPDGEEHGLDIPSADQTGLKIVTPFVHEEGVPLALTIDFDLRKSVRHVGGNGNPRYKMKPVLRLVKDAETGTLVGAAASDAIVCAYAAGATKDETSDCEGAVNTARVKDGRYTLAFLPEGSYEVRAFAADGSFRDLGTAAVVAGTPVEVGVAAE